MFLYTLLIHLSIICYISSLKLPTYLTPCKKSDPNISECALKSAREALKTVINGDKKYKVISVNPLELPVLVSDMGPNLQLTFENLHVTDFTDSSISSLKLDLAAQSLELILHVPKLEIISKYKMSGHILVLPIQGTGDTKIAFTNGNYTYKTHWTVPDGKFMKLDDFSLSVEFGGATFHFENLFDGDKLLGDNMNTVLNENWKDVVAEIGGGIGRTVGAIVNTILQGYFESVPYDEVFV